MSKKIALVGNPNSGKTTLFNALTGSNQSVGNWPGVTVEKKEGKLKGDKEFIIVDLPGIYSLSPYTLEEVISRNYIIEEKPEVVVNIVDGSNIERNLFLTTQVLELGIPVVLAVNMADVLEKRGTKLNIEKLSSELGCKVVSISAVKNSGIDKLISAVKSVSKDDAKNLKTNFYEEKVEDAISKIIDLYGITGDNARFLAVKILEKDSILLEKYSKKSGHDEIVSEVETAYDDDIESIVTISRYEYIADVLGKTLVKEQKDFKTTTDKIDEIVTNRWLALPIFAVVMYLVYYISVTTVGTWATDWANDGVFGDGWNLFGVFVPGVPVIAENILGAIGCADWLQSLIIDGIIGGVGAVLGFVPQMLVLFFFLAFLEYCGYMARVAFIMDRIFRRFGLSGKSFIPMLIGTGCSVPGIMASRTIESERDRRMTIMTTSFIPCGAKLPIIALIAGSMFDGASWVAPSAYFIGVIAVICSGIILKKTKMFEGDVSPFVMELPEYRMPTLSNILRSMWERGWSFIKKAGTIILLSAIVLWFLMSFGFVDGSFTMLEAEQLDRSILATIGGVIAPIFTPIGFGDWKMAVATVTGLIAKENVVGTFGVLYGMAEVAEDGVEIWGSLAGDLSTVAAYSFLIFNLLCAPCFAAMGAIKREMNNSKWFWFAIGYQTVLAYAVSLAVYQIGKLVILGEFGLLTVVGFAVVVFFGYLLFKPEKK
ncbi:MAG: ferrous iron transport protein B [Lachnospirales bacterium]